MGSFKITIIDDGELIPYERTEYPDLGPQLGQILNYHYFPGIKFYEGGRYRDAYEQLTYLIDRPTYIDGNPNQSFYLTTSYYLRGTIFLYHASGAGHLMLAKRDFEAAIEFNEKNYPAYLELSRVFSKAGLKDEAIAALQRLIETKPDKEMLEKAEKELTTLTAESK